MPGYCVVKLKPNRDPENIEIRMNRGAPSLPERFLRPSGLLLLGLLTAFNLDLGLLGLRFVAIRSGAGKRWFGGKSYDNRGGIGRFLNKVASVSHCIFPLRNVFLIT